MNWLPDIEAGWLWITLGLVLAGLEMLIPGVYLIWMAVAAIATGALTWLLGLSPAMQVVDFVFLSLITVFSVRRLLRDHPISSPDPMLNQRSARLVGVTARVVQAIENGNGRVRLDDSEWMARGPDTPAGEQVRVIGAEGITLLVERIVKTDENGASVNPQTSASSEHPPESAD